MEVFKKYLEKVHNLKNINSPKKVFIACVKTETCTLEEGDIFVNMVDSRNETTHIYSVEASRAVLSAIPNYYSAMIAVVERLNLKINESNYL